MPSGGPILVTGATGNTGRAVVEHAARLGARVRAAVRDPAAAAATLDPTVDAVRFDFADPDTFAPALAGAEGLFLLRPPAVTDVAGTLNRLIDQAVEAGVGHVVFLSVAGVERARFIPHARVERHLVASGLAWTMLRAGFFAQNIADAYRRDIVEDDRLYLPAGAGAAAWVDVRDAGEVAASALVRGELRGEAPVLVGPEPLDFHRTAGLLTEVLGRAIRYEPASIPGYLLHCRRRGEDWGYAVVKTMLHVSLRFGGREPADPTLERLLGRRPRDLRTYLQDHRHLWMKEQRTA